MHTYYLLRIANGNRDFCEIFVASVYTQRLQFMLVTRLLNALGLSLEVIDVSGDSIELGLKKGDRPVRYISTVQIDCPIYNVNILS